MKTLTNITDSDFLETPLSLEGQDAVEFEKLIFYLLDEMGFTDVVWRKGGEGNTAADGGRDIEASYWRVEPLGTTEEKYWFEVKFRAKQLSKSTVQSIVNNASGRSDLNHLIIVTNSTVSNSCIDWIKEFQKTRPQIKISVWQGHDIELILRKNPKTLAQFFSGFLNRSGKIKVLESKFLNFFQLPSSLELQELWESKDELLCNKKYLLVLAAILGEIERDGIDRHNWGIYIDQQTRLVVTSIGIYNIFSFASKIRESNRSEEIIIRGLSYLLQCILIKDSPKFAFEALMKNEKYIAGGQAVNRKIKNYQAEPILNCMLEELVIPCAETCPKVSYGLKDILDRDKSYFSRFVANDSKEEEKEKSFLVITIEKEKCEIGLVEEGKNCLLPKSVNLAKKRKEEILNILTFMGNVLKKRIRELIDI